MRPHTASVNDICDRCGATGIEIVEGTAPRYCNLPDNVVSLVARRKSRELYAAMLPVLQAMGLVQ